MRIGVIQASSQATKNQIIYDAVLKYAPKKSEVINFGCTMEENEKYSYIEISILVGILLASRTVDFVVTGCSSGQGMMLACNSMPDVICAGMHLHRRMPIYLLRLIMEMRYHYH